MSIDMLWYDIDRVLMKLVKA